MNYFETHISGIKQFNRHLGNLETITSEGVIGKAVKLGLMPTLRAAKANAITMVKGTMGDLLAKYLEIKPFKNQRRGSYGEHLMLSAAGNDHFIHYTKGSKASLKTHKESKNTNRYYIPFAIEYGHLTPYSRQRIENVFKNIRKSTGRRLRKGTRATVQQGLKGTRYHVKAIPFMRSASDANLRRATGIIGNEIKKQINTIARSA